LLSPSILIKNILKKNDIMTEIILNDEDISETLNDGNNDQINIPNIVVVQPPITTTDLSVRKNSIVIPSISNSSISSVLQIENNNNNNNTLLPICTSNSLGKKYNSFLINYYYYFLFLLR
jgi:hypothetical protein